MSAPLVWIAASAAAAWLVLAPPVAGQNDGLLDGTFYDDGRWSLPVVAEMREIRAVVEAPDGLLVFAGYRAGAPSLFWGRLDGLVGPTICPGPDGLADADPQVRAAVFDGAGRLVLAGTTDEGGEVQGFVARILYPSCATDPTFATDGVFRTDHPSGDARLRDIAIDAQGRIVWGGYLGDVLDPWIGRLTDAGAPDSTFDGDGERVIAMAESAYVAAVATYPDGRVAVGGGAGLGIDPRFLALRLLASGADDTSFDDDGRAEFDVLAGTTAESVRTMALDPETGTIALGGFAEFDAAVVRFTAAGEPDLSFSGDGLWWQPLGGASDIWSLERQSDGKLLVSGSVRTTLHGNNFVAVRLTPEGLPDGSFGAFGGVSFGFDLGGSENDQPIAGALHAGRLVLAGRADTDDADVGAVARLTIALVFADAFERGTTGAWTAAAP